jgi:hypothetical protein
MKDLRAQIIRLAYQKTALRPHLLPLLRVAGSSYALEDLYVALVEKGNKPFNIDTIKKISSMFVPTRSLEGDEINVALEVVNAYYGPPLTYGEEKMGARREVVVYLKIPQGTWATARALLTRALKDQFQSVKVLDAFRQPVNLPMKDQSEKPINFLRRRR